MKLSQVIMCCIRKIFTEKYAKNVHHKQVPELFLILENRPKLTDTFKKDFCKKGILKEDYQKTLKNLL